ncbi:antibiotic biosynthesis monooxygenase [Kitasatospora arboriphila]
MTEQVLSEVGAVVAPEREAELVALYRELVSGPLPEGLVRTELLRGPAGHWRVQSLWRDMAALEAVRNAPERLGRAEDLPGGRHRAGAHRARGGDRAGRGAQYALNPPSGHGCWRPVRAPAPGRADRRSGASPAPGRPRRPAPPAP